MNNDLRKPKIFTANELIDTILKHHSDAHPAIAVFDLDSTLFDVSFRTQAILKDCAHLDILKLNFPSECKKMETIEVGQDDWGIIEPLNRIGFDQNSSDFIHQLNHLWAQRFFSNDYLKYDQAYEGAVNFTQTLHQYGVKIIYLSGRDIPRMMTGTMESLKQWHFPLPPTSAALALKPHPTQDDEEFKINYFSELLKTTKEVIWFFENEPVNIEAIRNLTSQIKIIFFDSVHSNKLHSPHDIPHLKSFTLQDS